MQDLVFYAGPFLLLLGLLLSGRFIGEDAILARRPSPAAPAARLAALDAGPRAPTRIAAGAQHAPAPRPAGRAAARRLNRPRSSHEGGPLRTLACTAAAAALLLAAPVALAHQGNPNYRSVVSQVTPGTPGVDVSVLNFDDRLLLHNTSGKDVMIIDYQSEAVRAAAGRRDGRGQHELGGLLPQRGPARARPRCRRTCRPSRQWKQVSQQLAVRVARPPRALDGQGRPAAAARTRT